MSDPNELIQSTVDNTNMEWLQPSSPLTWKQRKNRDRTLVDLAERILRLAKGKDVPSKEMIISFLASLSTSQVGFMEKLVDCFAAKAEAEATLKAGNSIAKTPLPVDEKTEPPQHTTEVNFQQTGNNTQFIATETKENQQDAPSKETVLEETSQEETATEDSVPSMESEMDDFYEISDEEKELHLKILEYQKEHNVSYDHAASIVLK